MLIDDDFPTNLYHQLVIEEGDFAERIIVMQNAIEALAYLNGAFDLERPKPDLIFLDINMPRMNGWEFLEQYKNLPAERRADNVIVMLSTSANPDDIQRAEENEFVNEYHDKPLTEILLERIIAKYWMAGAAV